MSKKFIIIGIGVAVALVVGFFGWPYVKFTTLKSECLDILNSEVSEIKVYFAKGIDSKKIQSFGEVVLSLPGVVSVEVKTEAEALAEFKERHKNESSIQEAIKNLGSENPLQAYILIRLEGGRSYQELDNNLALKSTELGIRIENVMYDALKSGAWNVLSGLSFDLPLGGSKEFSFTKKIELLKNCTEQGSVGVVGSVFEN